VLSTPESDPSATEDPVTALREVRARFIQDFPEQVVSAGVLAAAAADPRTSKPLFHTIHQIAGLAGTVGFPTVSKRAMELEQLLATRSDIIVEPGWVQARLDTFFPAFADDRESPPQWASVPAPSRACKVLIAEDDPIQQQVMAAWLAQAGYATVTVASGDQVLRVARLERPRLILLDIDLPVVDGYQVFWDLRASSDVAATPVMLMSARVGADNRLTGLAVGADDYLEKPLEQRELLIRMNRLLNPTVSSVTRSSVLTYDAFHAATGDHLRTRTAAIAMIRLPAQRQEDVVAAFVGDLRKCDFVGRYDPDHLVVAMPDLEPGAACTRLRDMIGRLRAWAPAGLTAGVALESATGEHGIAQSIADAQMALAEARAGNLTAAVRTDRTPGRSGRRPTVILADDDLQTVDIVAPRMRAAGYHTVLAFDGQQALDAVRVHKADLLVIDLTMPKLSGFDVLERLRHSAPRPITIVLSGHRQSDDVSRATMLGASDYILKPFDPDDLMARVARQLGTAKAANR
jgi:two-component system cell cycle response regulator